MSFDSKKFRKAMGFFSTGVTIVTGLKHDQEPVGVTLNAFCSVSLEPPLVLICLANTTGCLDAFCEGEKFAVNILSEDQKDLSDEFAGPQEHKFKAREYLTWESGCPILPGCLVNMECTRTAIHEGGDHFIVIGHVDRVEHAENGRPLLFFQGSYDRKENA